MKGVFEDQAEFFKNGIPWSGDTTIDEFVDNKLNLTKLTGNAMVVMAKLNFFKFI